MPLARSPRIFNGFCHLTAMSHHGKLRRTVSSFSAAIDMMQMVLLSRLLQLPVQYRT